MSGETVRRTSSGHALRLVVPNAGFADSTDRAGLILPPERRSVAVGRHWAVRAATSEGITGRANQVVELLTSELLANAVLHGAGGQEIEVSLRVLVHDVVRVSVSDSLSARPVVLSPDPVAPSGRGMVIVEALSNRWGVEPRPGGGKTVWFEVDLDQY